MNANKMFDFEGCMVRTIPGLVPWFVLADVCLALEIANPSMAASRLDDDEKGISTVDTLGGPQQVVTINESGLYSLIVTSRKPAAKRFKKWVTAEVLPAIRRDGGYMVVRPEETPMELAIRTVKVLQATIERQVAQLAVAQPKAAALDRIATADGSFCVTDAAKNLQVRRKDLFSLLRSKGWIYRRAGCATDIAYQPRIAAGLLEHKVTTIASSDGGERTTTQVRVTAKGLAALAELLRQAGGGLFPVMQ